MKPELLKLISLRGKPKRRRAYETALALSHAAYETFGRMLTSMAATTLQDCCG
jgi:hypothetical protein